MQPFFLEVEGVKEELNRCPIKLIEIETLNIMRYYRYYKLGYLPNEGGIGKQSAKLLEAFEVIDNEFEKMREEQDAKRPHWK